jgi:hypothetical protein
MMGDMFTGQMVRTNALIVTFFVSWRLCYVFVPSFPLCCALFSQSFWSMCFHDHAVELALMRSLIWLIT